MLFILVFFLPPPPPIPLLLRLLLAYLATFASSEPGEPTRCYARVQAWFVQMMLNSPLCIIEYAQL